MAAIHYIGHRLGKQYNDYLKYPGKYGELLRSSNLKPSDIYNKIRSFRSYDRSEKSDAMKTYPAFRFQHCPQWTENLIPVDEYIENESRPPPQYYHVADNEVRVLDCRFER
jgi:hypothetical protein